MNTKHGSFVVGAALIFSSAAFGQADLRAIGSGGAASDEFWASAVTSSGDSILGWIRRADKDTYEAFRWSESGGVVPLPLSSDFVPTSISDDGRTVAGFEINISFAETYGFVWTEAGGVTTIPAGETGDAADVSGDGATVVGTWSVYSPVHGDRAYWWDVARSEMHLLERLASPCDEFNPVCNSSAVAISRDGSTIVGHNDTDEPNGTRWAQACRWSTADGVAHPLGDLPGGLLDGTATAVSANGVYIAGASSSAASGLFAREPFRWSATSGMRGLGLLPGYGSYDARGISSDGTVIVGSASNAEGESVAFIWDPWRGLRPLKEHLDELGVDVEGWSLTAVADMTPDGTTIVGVGVNPDGGHSVWVATIPPFRYADCDGDGSLGVNDFTSFRGRYLAGDLSADCNDDGQPSAADFLCFRAAFVAEER